MYCMWPHHFPNFVCPRPLAVYWYCSPDRRWHYIGTTVPVVCVVCRSPLPAHVTPPTRNNLQRCSKKQGRPAQTWLIDDLFRPSSFVQPIRVSMELYCILYDVSFGCGIFVPDPVATTTTRRKTATLIKHQTSSVCCCTNSLYYRTTGIRLHKPKQQQIYKQSFTVFTL